MNETGFVWVCNECGARNFTDSIHEDDLVYLACDSCGCNEFHKEPSDTSNVKLSTGEQRVDEL